MPKRSAKSTAQTDENRPFDEKEFFEIMSASLMNNTTPAHEVFAIGKFKKVEKMTTTNGETLLDFYKLDENGLPSEKRIVLTLMQLRQLSTLMPKIESIMQAIHLRDEKLEKTFALSDNVQVSISYKYAVIDIRQFFLFKSSNTLKPTRKGVSFTLFEMNILKEVINTIEATCATQPLPPFYMEDIQIA